MRFVALFEDRPDTGGLRDYKAGMHATIRVLGWRTAPGFENMVVGPKTQAV